MKDATWFEQELLKRVMSYDPTRADRAIAETIFREAMDAASAEMRERCEVAVNGCEADKSAKRVLVSLYDARMAIRALNPATVVQEK